MFAGIDFSFSALASGFISGVFGLYIFREGKKRAQYQLMLTGIAMMTYTYFTKGPFLDWGVGIALGFLAKHLWNEG